MNFKGYFKVLSLHIFEEFEGNGATYQTGEVVPASRLQPRSTECEGKFLTYIYRVE
jgi:hypothetical protein